MALDPERQSTFYFNSIRLPEQIIAYHFELNQENLKLIELREWNSQTNLDSRMGMCIAQEGMLWYNYGGSGVYSLESDDRLNNTPRKLKLPGPHINVLRFCVEKNLDTLLITTAQENLSESPAKKFPLSGRCVFGNKTEQREVLPINVDF